MTPFEPHRSSQPATHTRLDDGRYACEGPAIEPPAPIAAPTTRLTNMSSPSRSPSTARPLDADLTGDALRLKTEAGELYVQGKYYEAKKLYTEGTSYP